MERGRESPRPDRSDAWDPLPVRFFCSDDGCERAEMIEQSLCRNPRDSWDRGECRFGGPGGVANLGTLSVSRARAVAYFGAASRKEVKPQSRVIRVVGAKNRDPEIRQGQPGSPNCGGPKRPSVEIDPFDEQVGEARALPKTSYLRPESPPYDRCMQITHRLALHDCELAHDVVARRKQAALNSETTLRKNPRHAAVAFVNVRNDVRHPTTLAGQPQQGRHIRVPIPKQLALSRSESA
jgi:hypothetical protein